MKMISSRHNALVRAFREIADSAESDDTRVLLDGVHLVREACGAALEFEAVAVASPHLTGDSEAGQLARALESQGAPVFSVSEPVFRAMSPVRSPSGIVAIARRTPSEAGAISLTPGGFTLVATDIQDPGNLGGLIRAAEAGGGDTAVACKLSLGLARLVCRETIASILAGKAAKVLGSREKATAAFGNN